MEKLDQNVFSNLFCFFIKQKKWKKYIYIIFLQIFIATLISMILNWKDIILIQKNNQKIQKISQEITEKNEKNKFYSNLKIEKFFKNSNSKKIILQLIDLAKKNNLTLSEINPIKYKKQNGLIHFSINSTAQCQFLDCVRFLEKCSQIPITIINEFQLIKRKDNKEKFLTLHFVITTYFRSI